MFWKSTDKVTRKFESASSHKTPSRNSVEGFGGKEVVLEAMAVFRRLQRSLGDRGRHVVTSTDRNDFLAGDNTSGDRDYQLGCHHAHV